MPSIRNYEFKSEFAREHWARGREEGREEGRKEGRAESAADAVVKVLAARGIPVSGDGRQTIMSTTDLALLDRWLVQAVTASSIGELLGTAPPK